MPLLRGRRLDSLAGHRLVEQGHQSDVAPAQPLGILGQVDQRAQAERVGRPVVGRLWRALAVLGQQVLVGRLEDERGRLAGLELTDPGDLAPLAVGQPVHDPRVAQGHARGVGHPGRVLAVVGQRNGAGQLNHVFAVDHSGGVGRDAKAGQMRAAVAAEIDGRPLLARKHFELRVGRHRQSQGRRLLQVHGVRRGQRGVQGRIARDVRPGIVPLQFDDGDFGAGAGEADVELRKPDHHAGADDGDQRGRDPGPFDPADQAEHQPVQRHQHDQITQEHLEHEIAMRNRDAGRLLERRAGRRGHRPEIVPAGHARLAHRSLLQVLFGRIRVGLVVAAVAILVVRIVLRRGVRERIFVGIFRIGGARGPRTARMIGQRRVAGEIAELADPFGIESIGRLVGPVEPLHFDVRANVGAVRTAQQATVDKAVEARPVDQVALDQPERRGHDPAPAHAALDDQPAGAGQELGLGPGHQLDPRPGMRGGERATAKPGNRPALVQFGQGLVLELSRTAGGRRQVGLEEAVLELVQRLGPADDQLSAPVQPVEHGLLLFDVEHRRVDVVPNDVGHAGPAERLGRQRCRLANDGQLHAVEDVFHRVRDHAVGRRPHRVDHLEPAIPIGLADQAQQEILVRGHVVEDFGFARASRPSRDRAGAW